MQRRSKKQTGLPLFHRDPVSSSRFSPAFIEEVRACEDVDGFVDLMEERGLWLNRNAAQGVYEYLRSLGEETLSDDDLTDVTGGLPWHPSLSDPTVSSAVNSLLGQMAHR